MSDERMFTLEEANALLADVIPLLEGLRSAHRTMEGLHEDVMSSVPTNGGGKTHREFVDASRQSGDALAVLDELGVVVRDPEQGLIDFPAERNGERIFLCFRLGEDHIGFWHDTETGFAGRQPL